MAVLLTLAGPSVCVGDGLFSDHGERPRCGGNLPADGQCGLGFLRRGVALFKLAYLG